MGRALTRGEAERVGVADNVTLCDCGHNVLAHPNGPCVGLIDHGERESIRGRRPPAVLEISTCPCEGLVRGGTS